MTTYTKGDQRADMAFLVGAAYGRASGRDAAFADVAVVIERLCLSNPMNGDGHNYALGRAVTALDRLAGTSGPSEAAAAERVKIAAERDAAHLRLEQFNRDQNATAARRLSVGGLAPTPDGGTQ